MIRHKRCQIIDGKQSVAVTFFFNCQVVLFLNGILKCSVAIRFLFSHVFGTFSLPLFVPQTFSPFKDSVCDGLLSRSRRAMCICLLAHYLANKLPLWKHLNIKYDRRRNEIRFRVSPDTPTWGPSLSVAPEVYTHPKSSRRLNSTVQL